MKTTSWFLSAATCYAVRAKSLWPQSRPIRPAGTSQGTTPTTRTRPSTLTRRPSWSTTCWRSLSHTRCATNSTQRSATAHPRSDHTQMTPSLLTVKYFSLQASHIRKNENALKRTALIIGSPDIFDQVITVSWWKKRGLYDTFESAALWRARGMLSCLHSKQESGQPKTQGYTYFLWRNSATSSLAGKCMWNF